MIRFRHISVSSLCAFLVLINALASGSVTASGPAATLLVTSRTDSGPGSLRQALLSARSGDRIVFDPAVFPPANPASIAILDPLPALTQGFLTIDASNAGVILDGRYAPAYSKGLVIRSNGNVIKGLQIVGFPDDAIEITGDASFNTIGGDTRLGSAPNGEGNILTRNRGSGVDINGSGTMSNTVSGNLIGLDADGTEDFRVLTLALSPNFRADRTLFIGTRYHGVWRSTDGGQSWLAVNTGVSDLHITALAVSPNYLADGTVFAGSADGDIFRTTDRGATWEQMTGNRIKRSVVHLAISPHYAFDGAIFAATDGEGLFVSRDHGTSWVASSTGINNLVLHAVVISPDYAVDRTAFIAAWDVVFKSTDGGTTWTAVADHLTDGIVTLAVSPNYRQDRSVYFARRACNTDDVVWRSTDGGQEWAPLRSNPGWCTTRAMALAPDFEISRTLFVVEEWGGIFRSTDAGISWTRVWNGFYNWAIGISSAYAEDRTVFVGTRMGAVLKSVDRGITWNDVASALSERGNDHPGVYLRDGAQRNIIGGTSPGTRNIIGRNGAEGILIQGAHHNIIIGNLIGVAGDGRPAGNGIDGITVKEGASHNRIGGRGLHEGNVISANGGQGILFLHPETADNLVEGNLIGLTPDGQSALGNTETGVTISEGAHDNLIGGTVAEARNVISGNGTNGIGLWLQSAQNVVAGNFIGLDPAGVRAIGNRYQGIALGLGAHHNRVGGASPFERNVISGNGSNGISMWNAGTSENQVLGNYIGVDALGSNGLPNGENGVLIAGGASNNRIGGLTAGAGNVISGNTGAGVSITERGTSGNQVFGNIIGLAASGTRPLGNRWGIGCWDDAEQTVIEGNQIGGNRYNGIQLSKSHRNLVRRNLIGLNATRAVQIGNLENGILISEGAQDNVIGPGNEIAFNAYHGVSLWNPSTLRNSITANSIYANSEGGIRIGMGANGGLSRPAITRVEPASVAGIAPVAGALIEVFSDEGNQGRIFEGSTTADANGMWTLNKAGGFNDAYLTATATDAQGNTSEFAIAVARPQEVGSDPYEPDDACGQSRSIPADGTQQLHTFHRPGDTDWVRFDALTGRRYLIEALIPPGSLADVALSVYGVCGGGSLGGQDYAFAPGVRLAFVAPADGPIYLKLSHHSPDTGGVDFAYSLSVRIVDDTPLFGAVIIVAGRLTDHDDLQPNIHWVSNAAYRLFRSKGYPTDRLYYLATDTALDADGDGRSDVTQRTSFTALREAITAWAPQRVGPDRALTVFLVNHGDPEVFYLDKPRGEFLTTNDLDSWLRELEVARPGTKVNVIYEACYSGSFIVMPQSISRLGRVILTSTGAANLAVASARGAVFSDYFLEALGQGQSLYGSFRTAEGAIFLAGTGQTPWLDANGNGIPNEDEDQSEAARRGFTIGGTLSGDTDRWPPYIVQAQSSPAVAGGPGFVRAEVRDDLAVASVWAIIYPPNYTAPASDNRWIQDDLPKVPLLPVGGGWYEGSHRQFTRPGQYRVVVYAEDNQQLQAQPLPMQVTVVESTYLPLIKR